MQLRTFMALTALFFLLIGTSGPVSALEVQGKHGALDLSCEACHKTATPSARAPDSACKTCHGTYPQLAAKTAAITPNPHNSHAGELRCTMCHTGHKPPTVYCEECHQKRFSNLKPK